MESFRTIEHNTDLCVIGGGLSGLCAAVSAARHGIKVTLIQERPMLGGNASSEIRMWVCGAHGKNNRETGLIEELMLENLYRNPDRNYSVWDGIMYEMAAYQPGLELILNCSVNSCEMDGNRVVSVTGWQMTTESYHKVTAGYFADCSGDSVLAPLTGAEYRMGREGRGEFDEDIAPEKPDRKTMGMSCMIQAREETRPSAFIPPVWAHKYTKEDLLPYRVPDMSDPMENFWYMEIGGTTDCIADTEKNRDELLRIAYGIWDYIKNDPENVEKNKNWRLDWVGILPGKRESRRYVGDYVMTQKDVLAEGHFDDLVAYGGWTMDDHNPLGFETHERPNIFHPAPSPYGIPYRCLYSKNIENLFFAGRNISVTHTAMSSTRVMATCALLGQAVGTAASIAVKYGLSPRGVWQERITELRQTLMDDDCYLPFSKRQIPKLTKNAKLICAADNPENLRNGIDRPIGSDDNGCVLKKGQDIVYDFGSPKKVENIRIVFDSDLNRETLPKEEAKRERNMLHNRPLGWPDVYVPKTLIKEFKVEGTDENGNTVVIINETDNHQRLCSIDVTGRYKSIRLVPVSTWGSRKFHVFSFDVR